MWKPGMQGSSHFLSSKYVHSQVKQYPQVSELIKILFEVIKIWLYSFWMERGKRCFTGLQYFLIVHKLNLKKRN